MQTSIFAINILLNLFIYIKTALIFCNSKQKKFSYNFIILQLPAYFMIYILCILSY